MRDPADQHQTPKEDGTDQTGGKGNPNGGKTGQYQDDAMKIDQPVSRAVLSGAP